MRSTLSNTFTGVGIMAGTLGTVTALAGVVGLIVSTPQLCPDSLPAERCRVTTRNAAGLATQGLITAGVAGLLIVAGRVSDSDF